ncbi:hypothetical protein NSMM_80017 [Nitrosomonas mobilis]|uniref:Uncharacterized protein n=1 Tax=Nitrosomonas mobilis TaxID=51642 RepID=A0A1G5SKA3_9PROT|nr:hypothetical protein NSMM_80017 [Nitrosomonas mobilis]
MSLEKKANEALQPIANLIIGDNLLL